ncbi:unnamed protein product, partial [Bubo scandiacus]
IGVFTTPKTQPSIRQNLNCPVSPAHSQSHRKVMSSHFHLPFITEGLSGFNSLSWFSQDRVKFPQQWGGGALAGLFRYHVDSHPGTEARQSVNTFLRDMQRLSTVLTTKGLPAFLIKYFYSICIYRIFWLISSKNAIIYL